MSNQTRQIADLIERVMSGDPWHGPSVAAVLDGITAEVAARPAPGGAHSIWQLVLHMTAWAGEVTARINGRAAQDPEEGDWPAAGEQSAAQWRDAKAALFAAHSALAAAVRRLEEARLEAPVQNFRGDALGAGQSHYLTLHGLVQHTLYHAGQIALLKRIHG